MLFVTDFSYHLYCVLLGLQQPGSDRMGAPQSHLQADLQVTFTLMKMAGAIIYILIKKIAID